MSYYNECILVVEDDLQIRNFICYSLQAEEFRYFTASTGQAALSLLVSEQIDVILLDLGLPDIDGMDIIKKVREWSEMPIIVVSARDQDKEKANALDIGADDYLTKPFAIEELLARIRSLQRKQRGKQQGGLAEGPLRFNQLVLDSASHIVTFD